MLFSFLVSAGLFASSAYGAAIPDEVGQSLEDLAKRSPGLFLLEFDVVNVTDVKPFSNLLSKRSDPWYRTLYNKNGYYITYVYIGSNQQKIGVDIDTGSSDLWVVDAASGCQDNSCQYGDYDPSKSSSAKKLNQNFAIHYADGSSAEGSYYQDNIALGTCTNCAKIKAAQFASATENTSGFGVFGIGLPANEATSGKYPNFMDLMKSQGLIATKGYSLYLNSADATSGSIIFGGYDKAKIDGKLVTLPIISSSRLSVKLDSVTLNGKQTTSGEEALIDSGTSLAAFTQKTGDAIFGAIKGGHFNSDVGYYLCDCDANINQKVTLNFKGVSIDMVMAEAFSTNVRDSDGKSYGCGFYIGRYDFNILGDTFMRNAYTVFNYDAKTISIGKIKYTDDSNLVKI